MSENGHKMGPLKEVDGNQMLADLWETVVIKLIFKQQPLQRIKKCQHSGKLVLFTEKENGGTRC